MEDIEMLIKRFLNALPHIRDGEPIKDFIDEKELFEVATELARRAGLLDTS